MYKINDEIIVKVTGIKEYGIFFETDDSYTGLIHISELSDKFIRDINDFFKLSDNIKVVIMSIDEENKKLSASYKRIKDKKINRYLKIGSEKLIENTEIETKRKYKEIKNG